jgi:hypothetical protein
MHTTFSPLVMPKRSTDRTWVVTESKPSKPMPVIPASPNNAKARRAKRNGWTNR